MPEECKGGVRHVIVGAGTAGCLLARRLVDQGCDVVLIEQGGQIPADTDHLQALRWPFTRESSISSSVKQSEPVRAFMQRTVSIPQGRGLGGTSEINAMIWSAGSSVVYDMYWPESWCSERMRGYYLAAKELLGVQRVSSSGNMRSILNTAKSLSVGASNNDDDDDDDVFDSCGVRDSYLATINGLERRRVGRLVTDILDCKCTAQDGRLLLIRNSRVSHVIITAGRAEAVVIESSGDTSDDCWRNYCSQLVGNRVSIRDGSFVVSSGAGGEIVLCAGFTGSPRILASSIEEGCPIMQVLKCENLQDHTVLPYIFMGNWWVKDQGSCSNGVHGWLNIGENGRILSGRQNKVPKYQLLLVDGRIAVGLLPDLLIPRFASVTLYSLHIRPLLVNLLKFLLSLSAISWFIGLSFGFLLCEVQPRVGNRGKVSIESDGDRISLNYSFSREDIYKRRILMQLAKSILAKTSGLWFFELFPGPLLGYVCTDTLLELYIRLFSTSYYHQCGTCPMGPSDQEGFFRENFVVDEELKVQGISDLRVADASIFPVIPSSPIAATCMAVAERAAEMLLAKGANSSRPTVSHYKQF